MRTTGTFVAGLLLALTVGGCSVSSAPGLDDAGFAPTVTPTTSPTPTPAPTRTPTPAPPASASPTASPDPVAAPGTAIALVASLPVKGRAPMTGYDRDRFGQAWLDADRNGCDTRNDTLRRDLTALTVQPGTDDCVIERGTLRDPYTGETIEHVRGVSAIDIDHRVALGNAWATGAATWPITKRAAFANDPLNLVAVSASANRSKSDGDAATWLPPHRAGRCEFVAVQAAVKAKYGLWVTPAERDAMLRVLAGCPDLPAPRDPSAAPTVVDHDLRE